MQKVLSHLLFYICSFSACAIMSVTTGCASGGFSLTRKYASWLNSQNIILRIVLYIFGFVVFFVTLLVDMVVLNTVDFWQGKVSAGDYQFKDGGKTYQVKHEYLPASNLKRSTIVILDDAGQKPSQQVVLAETVSGEIELSVDGQVRARAHDIQTIPSLSLFDEKGKLTEERTLWQVLTSPVSAVAQK